jgi:hypothetical protein
MQLSPIERSLEMAKPTVRKKSAKHGGKSPHFGRRIEVKMTPLEYMFELMNDERLSPMESQTIARTLAPYFHPKLKPLRPKKGEENA